MSSLAASVGSTAVRHPAGDGGDALAFLDRGLQAAAGKPETVMMVLPAPIAAPESFLELCRHPWGFFWDPPGDAAVTGAGAAHRIPLAGPERIAVLRWRARRVWRRLAVVHHAAASPLVPRLYGGMAFHPGGASRRPWREFGDGCFTLPRFLYSRQDDHAELAVAVPGVEMADADARRALLEECAALLDGLALAGERGGPPAGGPPAEPRNGAAVSDPEWLARVEAIRGAIASGAFAKIVAARRSVVELASTPTPSEVLHRLAEAQQGSTRFAFCRRHAIFLGATPERLIAKQGRTIRTEALAGSIASGGERAGGLLRSGKDRHEQQLVVDSIVRCLAPLCARLQVATRPAVREFRHVMHLHTPIAGTLKSDRDILALVAELHPTPAVGGVPTAAAVDWIAEHERDERGWYAAPVGWFDAAGDGEFAVALRSCVVSGPRAYLHAGAGIVAGSDPRRELAETELKLRALRAALGD
ncbi:MAG: isochorismate synthase [bacterium]|nr:isochorismate synthase [bacterium]